MANSCWHRISCSFAWLFATTSTARRSNSVRHFVGTKHLRKATSRGAGGFDELLGPNPQLADARLRVTICFEVFSGREERDRRVQLGAEALAMSEHAL